MGLLKNVNTPADFKEFDIDKLSGLADEVRKATIEAVSNTGGHLGAGLGVVELTVALHHVFDTPKDKIIWDVGHQTYPHKILTGRKDKVHTLRQASGLSGFTKRSESEYDCFGAGHSSTSISAALGMAAARDLKKQDFEVVAVIGDGAMSAGMAYEAMNNAGAMNSRLIVVLNDNEMSIAPPVGAMSNYLSKMVSSKPYLTFRDFVKRFVSKFPDNVENLARRAEKYTRSMVSGSNIFEDLGFYYVGPVDGHNLESLVPILKNIRDDRTINHPVLIHVVTEKGHGYDMPEAKDEKLHAVSKFDVQTGVQHKVAKKAPSYTEIFSKQLIKQALEDDKIVAITAAMPSGTGLDRFSSIIPDRFYDVGIAEQHAVTFAAGMATEGYKPYCAIYSTFLQRAYDQVVHDVAIQSLPVRFAIDRAGLVGADGATHAGSFDIAFLANLPNFVVMAPSDDEELARMVVTAANIDDRPSAFRFPRGEALGIEIAENVEPLEIGKANIVERGEKVAILSFGTRLEAAKEASKHMKDNFGLQITVVDARFAKPLDEFVIANLAKENKMLITIEEGAVGGFGSQVVNFLQAQDLYSGLIVKNLCLPDEFVDHGNVDDLYSKYGLNSDGIISKILKYKSIIGLGEVDNVEFAEVLVA